MHDIRTADGIVPVSDFKAHIAQWLDKVTETDAPVVVTQNGRAAGVLLSPAAYDALTEQARFVAAVQAGLADAEAGRVRSTAEVRAEIRKRLQAGTR